MASHKKMEEDAAYICDQVRRMVAGENYYSVTLPQIRNALEIRNPKYSVSEEYRNGVRSINLVYRGVRVTKTVSGKNVRPVDLIKDLPQFWADILGIK
jgi:hypothetical protein